MKTPNFTHLLFDLDHTLWDFEKNSEETLRELYLECGLNQFFKSETHFFEIYHPVNNSLWDAYGKSQIDRNTVKFDRFSRTLNAVGIQDTKLVQFLAEEYVLRSPCKTHLIPGALAVLEKFSKRYTIVIVTNGFKEVQYRKIHHSGLEPYVDQVIISEDAGSMKPEAGFFDYLVQETGISLNQGLVIGDNLQTDILGAKEYGFQTVFFNPEGIPDTVGASFVIRELRELLKIVF